MKTLILALTALVSMSTFASPNVYLNGSYVNVDSNPATLIKTHNTPSSVNLSVNIPTTVERCDEQDMRTRYVTVTSGAQCGYDSVRYLCGGRYSTPTRRGSSYNPPRGGRGSSRGRVSIPAGRRYNPVHANNYCYRNVARTCSVAKRYCSNPYYVTVDKVKNFNLTFSKFSKTATIEFALDQDYNLDLDVISEPQSCVTKTIYGSNGVKTGAKIKLKRRCR